MTLAEALTLIRKPFGEVILSETEFRGETVAFCKN